MTDEPEQLTLFPMGGIDLPALRQLREELREMPGRARLTLVGYAADWRIFSRWCAEAGKTALPASDDTVSLYTLSMLKEGKRASTVIRYLASIVDRHKRARARVPSVADARESAASMRRKRGERAEGKTALSARNFALAAKACDARTNLGARDRALIVLGFATSMRRSELAGLQLSDLSFDKPGVVVRVRKSKTDQEAVGRDIPVWPGKRASTDPIRVLRHWIAKRGKWDGPLFCRVQTADVIKRRPINGESVNDAVKRAVVRVGLDPKTYGAHSLRAGAITTSAALGRSNQELKALSGHRSDKMVAVYVRGPWLSTGRNPLAGAM